MKQRNAVAIKPQPDDRSVAIGVRSAGMRDAKALVRF